MLIDHTNGRVVDVLENREKATLVKWLSDRRETLLKDLEEATTDMWESYPQAVREVFGNKVRIVVDRFHVVNKFHESITHLRRKIHKGLTPEDAEELKGSRWLWVTNPENLTTEQSDTLARLKKKFPELKKMWFCRQRFCRLFSKSLDPAAARQKLLQWCQRAREDGFGVLEQFCRMIETWLEPISNYFVNRSSNGRTEGFNHGIRGLLWRTCGMHNFQHFALRVLHCFGS